VSHAPQLQRIEDLTDELGRRNAGGAVRNALAIARGWVELGRTFGDPINAARVDGILDAIENAIRRGVDISPMMAALRETAAAEIAARIRTEPPAPDHRWYIRGRANPPPGLEWRDGRVVTKKWITSQRAEGLLK
jgi:hypothetical protein